jgi:hypothetical protein
MEAIRDHPATLVDLLDRVLEKGLVLHADVIISVSGIPLIGLKLSALLASVDTMIQYGIWEDWDCAIRTAAREEDRKRLHQEQQCLNGEYPVFRSLCSCRLQPLAGEPWKSGTLFLTGSRIICTDRSAQAILFESALCHLSGFFLHEAKTAETALQHLDLVQDNGTIIALRSPDAAALVGGIGKKLQEQNLAWAELETCPFPGNADPARIRGPFLVPGAGG